MNKAMLRPRGSGLTSVPSSLTVFRALGNLIGDRIVRVKNSLKSKENKVVYTELSNHRPVTWYACGPTVYDVAHLGHARNYIATDILRRILMNHFQFEVKFAMGMTDIDDKIINKGKSQGYTTLSEFIQLARYYEVSFNNDMDRLGIMRPNANLRVTEHIDEIVSFIQRLIDNGHAYESDDGVYFSMQGLPKDYDYDKFGCVTSSTQSFEDDPSQPVDTNNNSNSFIRNKRDARDFALWKKALSSGSEGWKSPWGWGRPGWHIECSAMTHAYFGNSLDIHSGGMDLKFPHHNNEILQSECHHCNIHANSDAQWVGLWIHTGHLHIAGRKMSKSLKNFISITEYLQNHAAEDLRYFCLMHKYSAILTYSEEQINIAKEQRKYLLDFFTMVDMVVKTVETIDNQTNKYKLYIAKPSTESKALENVLEQTKSKVNFALADDFDTPNALYNIHSLVSEGQKYLSILRKQIFSDLVQDNSHLPIEPLLAVRKYVETVFAQSFGLQLVNTTSTNHTSTTIRDDKLMDNTVNFRTKLRGMAITGMKSLKKIESSEQKEELNKVYKHILAECDSLRDSLHNDHNVKIEDIAVGQSKWTWKE
jgi:cysteinyl-tRNA synthetase